MNKKIVSVVIFIFFALGIFVWQKQFISDENHNILSKEKTTRYDQELNLLKSDLASLGRAESPQLPKFKVIELEELISAAEEKIFELQRTEGKFRNIVKADLEFLLEDLKDKTKALKQKETIIK